MAGDEPSEKELQNRDLSHATEESPALHEDGVRVSDSLADGEVDEAERDDQLAD